MKWIKKIYKILVLEILENLKVLSSYLILKNQIKKSPKISSVSVVIFSKDRPLQLEALLESYFEYFEDAPKPYIIYNYSNQGYGKAYSELFSRYSNQLEEELDDSIGFKLTLKSVISRIKSNHVFFLVDDILFKKNFSISTFFNLDNETVPSLRLGKHLKKCYTLKKDQALPHFIENKRGLLHWKYSEGEHDWGYPLSVDGHIFDTKQFSIMINALNFKAPNSLEAKMQKFNFIYRKFIGVCNETSYIFNIPCNKVQTENDNHAGEFHQDDLLEIYPLQKIDYKKFENIKNESCHQEVSFDFKNR